MKGQAYPVLTVHGAIIMTRLARDPASATTLAEEGVVLTRGGAQSFIERAAPCGLIRVARVAVKVRQADGRMRAGPPHLLYEVTRKGRAALAAHRAAIAAFKARMRKG